MAVMLKRFETSCKNGGLTTQKHNIKVSRSIVNIQKIVGNEPRLKSNNLISLQISNT